MLPKGTPAEAHLSINEQRCIVILSPLVIWNNLHIVQPGETKHRLYGSRNCAEEHRGGLSDDVIENLQLKAAELQS